MTVRSSHVARVLEKMDIDSGTGPDGLSTRVLKECAREISLPLAKLIRRIIAQGFWPTALTIHWLLPLELPNHQFDCTNIQGSCKIPASILQ